MDASDQQKAKNPIVRAFAVFTKYFVLGALVGTPIVFVLAVIGVSVEVALFISATVTVVALVLVPEMLKK
jgi:cation transport ATPase